MPWVTVESPTIDQLDKIMLEALSNATKACHDCGVSPGEVHIPGCDTARCLVCGGQRLSCECPEDDTNGDGDIWTGLWPGTIECYEYGLVCYWEGPHPLKKGKVDRSLRFSYNDEATLSSGGVKKPKRLHSFRDFLIK